MRPTGWTIRAAQYLSSRHQSSLPMVFSYQGVEVPYEDLLSCIEGGPDGGTTRRQMEKIAERYGFSARARSHGTLEDIIRELDAGNPVIVDWKPSEGGHYSVLRGYGDGWLYVRDPQVLRRCRIGPERFLRTWGYDKPENWYLVLKHKKQ